MTGVWQDIHWLDGLIVATLFLIVWIFLIWQEHK